MNQNLTDITLVVDRSGSMASIRDDAEGGVNNFIREQAAQPGEALLTLVEFDTEYDFVHSGVPVQNAGGYELRPRGATALLDAVGRAINGTGQRLAQIPESERPGLVVFVVVTDGLENSSCEFNKTQIKQMIERQTNEYNWQFTFLGADQDAFAEAGALGIPRDGAAKFRKERVARAYRATSGKVVRMRLQSATGETVHNSFTDEERKEME